MKKRLPLSLEGRDHRRMWVGKGCPREKEQHEQRHRGKEVDNGVLVNGWRATGRGKN